MGNGVYFYIHTKADVTLETGWYKDVETSSLVRLPTVCRILDPLGIAVGGCYGMV